MVENSLHRIKKYIDFKGISVSAFEKSVDFSNGSFASQLKNNKSIGSDKLEKILNTYTDLNPEWVFCNIGEMLKDNNSNALNTNITPFESSLNTINDVEALKTIIRTQNQTIKAQEIALLSKETEMNERALIVDAVRKKLIDNFHLSSSISFEQNYLREIKEQEQEIKK